jgi:hypothetical protein
MSVVVELRKQIETTLGAFASAPLLEASLGLFELLGYQSERRMKLRSSTAEGFLGTFDRAKTLNPERALLANWRSIEFLFQLTDAEVQSAAHGMDELAFDSKGKFDGAEINSYLFLAIELTPRVYTRTELAGVTRSLNRLFDMPAMLLFKHGDTISLGIIHRRLNKRDQAKDVLEKVTLVKDIAFADPIRAHIEILNDFAFANLDADFGVSNFVRLHEAWQKRLGSYALSNDFYREIADWYFWAHHQVHDGTIRLPQHCDTDQEKSLFLIRLLTRVIFSWFLVEKRLIPTDLFREHRLKSLLKEFTPTRDPKKPDTAPTYYHAVLQNLFFGTLNMPPDQRGFREKKKDGQRYDLNFGITNLWRYETDFRSPADWLTLASRVPFLNGGLFDCLDDKSGQKKTNFILDGFSDNPKLACHLPNDLFFGPERIVDLSSDYGEEDQRTARSKKAKVRGLVEILSRYKFTIEENTPLEEEIALDPELLGKVFENLLASYNEDTRKTARKALGAFYTPREIVSYMVDEALKSYLGAQVPRCKSALDDLFSNKATLKEIKPDIRDALISAIGRVKILDPACGSGAFPMGALHRLVDLLQKLDSNNESWKRDRLAEARRYRKLLEESGAANEEIASCDARISDIEKSFDSRFHALDFARKLYLIENSIYGVDIQPIATQIAKLRFFISLVVDQKVDMKADNLGVRPLPNLETRLVAADTLIPIEKSESDLFSAEIEKLRAELAAIRHEHFNARSPAAKRKWRDADAGKRLEIAGLLEREHAIPRAGARKLAAWDPYDQNTFAPFFDSEWMFGLPIGKVRLKGRAAATLLGNLSLINEVDGQTELTPTASREIDSGFDIVIGNPPYALISGQLFQDVYAENYPLLSGKPDLYRMFLERCPNLLPPSGCLAFIIPNSILAIPSAARLRKHLMTEYAIALVIDLTSPVFGAAVNNVIVMIERRAQGKTGVRVGEAHSLEDFTSTLKLPPQVALDKWMANERHEWDIHVSGSAGETIAKIEATKTRVGDLTSEIVLGMQVYHNTLHSDVQMQRRIHHSHTKRGTNWIPEFSGKDIKGFRLPTETPSLFVNAGATDIYHKPAQQYFEKPRIILREIPAARLVAAYADTVFSVNKSCYVIVDSKRSAPEIKSLMVVLVSAAVMYWVSKKGDKAKQALFPRITMNTIRKIPVPSNVFEHSDILSRLADYILWSNEHFAKAPANQSTRDPLMLVYWERVLNGLVYELYFPEEMHGAGLHLFNIVVQTHLPEISAITETQRLPRLRKLFEALHDGAHPLRIALDKLQTLDTVRIIEGKA